MEIYNLISSSKQKHHQPQHRPQHLRLGVTFDLYGGEASVCLKSFRSILSPKPRLQNHPERSASHSPDVLETRSGSGPPRGSRPASTTVETQKTFTLRKSSSASTTILSTTFLSPTKFVHDGHRTAAKTPSR